MSECYFFSFLYVNPLNILLDLGNNSDHDLDQCQMVKTVNDISDQTLVRYFI